MGQSFVSLDVVDDLHAAEEHGEALIGLCRTASERLMESGGDWSVVFRVAAVLLAASEERFVRPGCEEAEDGQCIQGEDCGGFHSWVPVTNT